MNIAQRKHGEPLPTIEAKIKTVMDAVVQEFIQSASFVVMATSNHNGDCDASPKGGKPGFVKVLNDKTLLLPDIAGNKLFQSYENIESNPKAGLIFIIPGCDLTVRVNARADVVDGDELQQMGIDGDIFNPDKKADTLQALRLRVDEVYPHCPRAFRFSRLWDTDFITENADDKSERYWYQRWARLGKET
ncbi:MAG: pyridoxamine 5'-phosphate oxidase family protein [Pseudomonadales bacterium]